MSPYRMDRIESAVRLVIAFTEAFNRHDIPGMLALLSADCVYEDPSPPPDGSVYKGKDALAQYWPVFFSHLPGAHMKIEEIFGLGIRCLLRWRLDWTDAEGGSRHVRGVDIFRLQNGLICECLTYIKG